MGRAEPGANSVRMVDLRQKAYGSRQETVTVELRSRGTMYRKGQTLDVPGQVK